MLARPLGSLSWCPLCSRHPHRGYLWSQSTSLRQELDHWWRNLRGLFLQSYLFLQAVKREKSRVLEYALIPVFWRTYKPTSPNETDCNFLFASRTLSSYRSWFFKVKWWVTQTVFTNFLERHFNNCLHMGSHKVNRALPFHLSGVGVRGKRLSKVLYYGIMLSVDSYFTISQVSKAAILDFSL